MAFTKWSFPWSSLWGGGLTEEAPEAPGAEILEPTIGGIFWLAYDQPNAGQNELLAIKAADSIGWAPRSLGAFGEGGNLTVAAYQDTGTSLMTVKIVRSDVTSGIDILSGYAPVIEAMHSELFGSDTVTGIAGPRVPSVVGFSEGGSSEIIAHNFALTDITAAPNVVTVWDNELGKSVPDLRFVSIENDGTVIVSMANSTVYPTQAFFLKPTSLPFPALSATELLIDLRPDPSYTVVPDRFHVVETHNRVLLFYYEVIDGNGGSHVAFMAYTPFHATFASDTFPFNAAGIVQEPSVVLVGHRPILSQKGARRHPVSNTVVIGVEPEDTDARGLQIHWYATQGYGYTSFGPPEVWDETNHPHLFGGRLGLVAENRVIRIISVGWSDARHGGDFPIVGSLQLNDIPSGAADFRNFYRADTQSNLTFLRTCLGVLYKPRTPSDSNPGGIHRVRYGETSTLEHEESKRGGYHLPTDFLLAEVVLPLDEFSSGSTPGKVGPNASADGSLVVSTGIVGQSIYFYESDASIIIPGFEDLNNDSVAVSCWVYPENSTDQNSDPEDFTIALQVGSDDIVWRLNWREDLGEFHWRVVTAPGGAANITSSTLGALPEKHWYHVTGTYDAVSEKSQLFINGFLVAENQFAATSVLAHEDSRFEDVILGHDPGIVTWRSFQGRIDDFVIGKRAGEQFVQGSYHHGLLSTDGLPMRGSRDGAWRYQDQVVGTASLTGTADSGAIYTVAMRRVSMSPLLLLRNQLVFDVWKVTKDASPEFMGLIVMPTECYDRRGFVLTSTLGGPTVDSAVESFEMTAVYGQDFNQSVPRWQLIWHVRGGTEGGATNAAHIYRTVFDPDLPSDANATPSDIVTRVIDPEVITAVGASFRPNAINGNELVVYAAITDGTAAGSYLYLIRGPDFALSGLATANQRLVTNFLPPPDTSGSFFGYNYTADFGNTHPPYIRGIVARPTVAGTGFPTQAHNGGTQIIFGLQAFPGNTEAQDNMIVGTLYAYLPPEAFAPPVGGDFPIELVGLPRQLDQYGVGGIDPFIPLAWMPHPTGVLGDSVLLGRTGTHRHDSNVRDGNGGLAVYSVPRQGTWGVQMSLMAGPYWSANLSQTIGASAALATTPGDGEDSVRVYVARPHPDKSDKFSTLYVSQEEAASGGWVPEDLVTATVPVLRRNDRVSTVLWLGYSLNVRNLTEEAVGGKPKVGDKYRYGVVLRWSYPGAVVTGVV